MSDSSVIAFARLALPGGGGADIKVHSGMGNPYASGPFSSFIGVGNALSFAEVENKTSTDASDFTLQLALPGPAETDPKLLATTRHLAVAARNANFEDRPLVVYMAVRDGSRSWPQPYPLLLANVSQVVIEPRSISVTAYTSAATLDKVWYVPTLQEDWSQKAFRNGKDGVFKFNTRELAETGVQF